MCDKIEDLKKQLANALDLSIRTIKAFMTSVDTDIDKVGGIK